MHRNSSLMERLRQSSTRLLALLLVAFVVGCGSTRDDFVFTGTAADPTPPPTTGSLVFNFTQGQTDPSVVPQGTSRLLFEFFALDNQQGEKTRTDQLQDFAASIVIDGVPTTTSSVRVTAQTSEGVPLGVFVANVEVGTAEPTEVDLGAFTPVTVGEITVSPDSLELLENDTGQLAANLVFSNGTILTQVSSLTGLSWISAQPEIASVNTSGVVTGLAEGTTSVTATFSGSVSNAVEVVVEARSPLEDLVALELSTEPDLVGGELELGSSVEFVVTGVFQRDGDEVREPLGPESGVVLKVEPETSSVLDFDAFTAQAEEVGEVQVAAELEFEGATFLSEPLEVEVVPTRILLIETDGVDSPRALNVKNGLEATEAFGEVTVWDYEDGVPSLEDLASYHATLVFPEESTNLDLEVLGDRLADYYDQGGRVVLAMFAQDDDYVRGRFYEDGYNLFPASVSSGSNAASLGQINEPESPLLEDFEELSADSAFRITSDPVEGAIVVAEWDDGSPLVVRGTVQDRARVDLNFYPVNNDIQSSFWTGDGFVLMRNALLFR